MSAGAQRICITGASHGIGSALSRAYARPGMSLVLCGRNVLRLEGVASACRALGATAEVLAFDTRDRDAAREALMGADAAAPIDLLIANAGLHAPTGAALAAGESAYDEFETNIGGTLHTVLPLAEAMAGRGRGQIAVVSSLAAYTAMPDSPGYAGSKAALLMWGLSLRGRLRPAGVKVSVVCPGYVDAGMGDRFTGAKLFVVPVDRAAARIIGGLSRNEALIAFPRTVAWLARLSAFLPDRWQRAIQDRSRFEVLDEPGDGKGD